MAYLPTPGDRLDPTEITAEHRSASSALLAELCSAVTSAADGKADRHLHVRVGHYEQPGFLNPKLYGFWLLPVRSGEAERHVIPGLDRLGMDWAIEQMADWTTPEALDSILNGTGVAVQSPNDSSEGTPSVWACVINSAIETQIESTLTALAMLLARQSLVQDMTAEQKVASIPEVAARVDEETTRLTSEEIRNNGWQSACRAIRSRAAASGFALHVEYRSPLLDAEQVRSRMPLTRHVYNASPIASTAIDKIVSVLTQGWTIVGPGPEQILQKTRDMLELSGIPALTAHAVRDGFVCGMGVLSLESVPIKNPWLIRPEEILELTSDYVIVEREHGRDQISPILPMKGGIQIGSTLGLSILEPLVITTATRETFLHTLLSAKVMQNTPGARAQVGDWPERSHALAERQLTALAKTFEETFNPAALRMPAPKSALYSPGMELMRPAVASISIGG
ncbi:hypothetical protein [Kribbella sp. ALI-6-A]|uniref:hypothetical protein n=1 Tax=Kribbella sp. ALI-6-A TaxID=1933817 RepID=UPI00117B97F5|nr:hypothetical protein [Kribbella sp. ALI-6-A]